MISLQCSWVRRLYDHSFHEWKVIPLKLIEKSFRSHFKFTLIFYSTSLVLMICHLITKTSSVTGKKYSSIKPETPSCTLSQYW